jgi:hypothetical protein
MRVCQVLLLFSIAISCVATLQGQAQQRGSSAMSSSSLAGRTLKSLSYAVRTGTVSTSCGTSGCSSTTALVPAVNVACPSTALPSTCTYYIHVEAQTSVSSFDNGLFQFLVDGKPASPGALFPGGYFSFQSGDPNSGNYLQAHSYAAVGVVSNSANNQAHTIRVQIGCADQTGDGCSAQGGLATVEIAVSKP